MTHVTRYLCIDDQQRQTIDPLLNQLSDGGRISFEYRTPQDMADQLNVLHEFAGSANGGPIGLLLDLRLDMDADADGNRVAYRGPTLAQELRTQMAEGLPSFPIVLWSVNKKFGESFAGDESSHDLFDAVYGKDEAISTQPKQVSLELDSLARGYLPLQRIANPIEAAQLLGLQPDETSDVYARFFSEFIDTVRTRAPHDIANLLLKGLIGASGLLVNELTLAARLGVDTKSSGPAWADLKRHLQDTSYQGPFHEGWPRWWWFRVEDWWAQISEGRSDLRRLNAEERVSRIKERLDVSLVAAQPILTSYSSKFFTLCAGTGAPLDPVDGLRVVKRSSKSWHDTGYVSGHAALERIEKSKWRLDPLDRDRLDRLKEKGNHGSGEE